MNEYTQKHLHNGSLPVCLTYQQLTSQLLSEGENEMRLREVSRLLYQMKITNQVMTSNFEKETGFSLTRYELMMFLKETGKCSQTNIQSELCIDRAAVTRHLKRLEEKGYVIRERNKQNNREIFVEVTNKAHEALEKCESDHNATNTLSSSLSELEEKQLSELLDKLMEKKRD